MSKKCNRIKHFWISNLTFASILILCAFKNHIVILPIITWNTTSCKDSFNKSVIQRHFRNQTKVVLPFIRRSSICPALRCVLLGLWWLDMCSHVLFVAENLWAEVWGSDIKCLDKYTIINIMVGDFNPFFLSKTKWSWSENWINCVNEFEVCSTIYFFQKQFLVSHKNPNGWQLFSRLTLLYTLQ